MLQVGYQSVKNACPLLGPYLGSVIESPNGLPSFQTDRLTVRARTMADLGACLVMDRDPLVTRFIPGPWADPAAHRAFVEDRIRRTYPPGMGYWSIVASTGFVGWILLTPLNLDGPEIEIGWRLVRAAWGQGYATEAARAAIDWAWANLDTPRLISLIHRDNQASMRVARRLGERPDRNITLEGNPVTVFVIDRPPDR